MTLTVCGGDFSGESLESACFWAERSWERHFRLDSLRFQFVRVEDLAKVGAFRSSFGSLFKESTHL